MSRFAGSAIKQGPNVGRIDKWSQWNPTTEKPLWLLLSGATDPPKQIEISDRKPRDAPGDRSGVFLAGVTHDLSNMEDTVGARLFNTVKDLYLTKDVALGHIHRLFETCRLKEVQPMLYYTGHGEIGTGNWCFKDGTISIQEIFGMVPEGCFYPMIFSDACFSGHWANFCINKGIAGFHCLAACPEYSTAIDTKGQGGDLTLFMTGKKPRPQTEPMYSGGNLHNFPVTTGFDFIDYTEFISSYIFNTKRIVVSQSMHKGYLSACFVSTKLYRPRPAVTWWIIRDYSRFVAFVKTQWDMSRRVYSIACDERFGFGVFLMENYGTRQVVLTNTFDIQKFQADGFKITACTAQRSTFCIVMTKGTKEHEGKSQVWITGKIWAEVKAEIQKGYDTGKAITGICYSTGREKYFVVMTEMSQGQGQCFIWQTGSSKEGYIKHENFMKQKTEEGYSPTIIFNDPTDDKILFVMTKDQNIEDYIYRINYKMKS